MESLGLSTLLDTHDVNFGYTDTQNQEPFHCPENLLGSYCSLGKTEVYLFLLFLFIFLSGWLLVTKYIIKLQ